MRRIPLAIAVVCLVPALAGAVNYVSSRTSTMPYEASGLSERQAAAHLLERFTFGPTPGQVDEVTELGLERWFTEQLYKEARSDDLDRRLAQLGSLELTIDEILQTYPRPGFVRRQMINEGLLDTDVDPKEQRRALRAYYEEKGYRPQRQIIGELIAQKVFRAVDSPNQIREVMVDFWFNHFYVSAVDNQSRRYVGTYERDAIRPFVFESFGTMLEATAKHPAMLRYLDNAQSSAAEGTITTASLAREELRDRGGRYERMADKAEKERKKREERMEASGRGPRRGINENYARELLELHTLGVDGGYTQDDVVDVARALTGWTVLPEGERRERMRNRFAQNPAATRDLGFVIEGDFFFNAEWHDAGEKRILGSAFPSGGRLDEGEAVLALLASHPSTARHIAHKLAVRFVADSPPSGLVDQLADVFRQSRGDMKAVLWAIVQSPEFWSTEAVGAKIKTPFELAVSSVRSVNADVGNPRDLVRWIGQMGQPLYRYEAPTGFPDRAEMWVNAGALLHRMNFGLSLAAGQVKGVRVDLAGLQNGREPESAEAALGVYAKLLMPERDIAGTVEVLGPLVGNPDLAGQIRKRSDDERTDPGRSEGQAESAMMDDDLDPFEPDDDLSPIDSMDTPQNPVSLAQVVGLILGSPEFQRR